MKEGYSQKIREKHKKGLQLSEILPSKFLHSAKISNPYVRLKSLTVIQNVKGMCKIRLKYKSR